MSNGEDEQEPHPMDSPGVLQAALDDAARAALEGPTGAEQKSDEEQIADNLAAEIFHRAREAVYKHALVTGQALDVNADDIPRLLVAAACRTVEILMEVYDKNVERNRSHGRIDYAGDRQRRAEIVEGTSELIGALEEGLKEAHKIRLSLLPREHR